MRYCRLFVIILDMAADLISTYIHEARKRDLSNRTIRENLLDAGWSESEVQAAFDADLPVPVPPGKTPQHRITVAGSGTMWDAFEHILLFISMYVLAFGIGAILFTFVDRWLPGVNDSSGYINRNGIIINMSALIVSYPLFSFLFYRITKRTLATPAIRLLKARKILIYFTLVVAFVIVISNIISLVYLILSGDVTLNVFMKIMIMLLIAGVIFAYYLQQVKEDRQIYA